MGVSRQYLGLSEIPEQTNSEDHTDQKDHIEQTDPTEQTNTATTHRFLLALSAALPWLQLLMLGALAPITLPPFCAARPERSRPEPSYRHAELASVACDARRGGCRRRAL